MDEYTMSIDGKEVNVKDKGALIRNLTSLIEGLENGGEIDSVEIFKLYYLPEWPLNYKKGK